MSTSTSVSEIKQFTKLVDQNIFDDSVSIDVMLVRSLQHLQSSGVATEYSLEFSDSRLAAAQMFVLADSNGSTSSGQLASNSISLVGLFVVQASIELDCGTFVARASCANASKASAANELLSVLNEKANIAFRFKEERRFERAIDEMVRLQLEGDLQPKRAWAAIATQSTLFLPDFEPFSATAEGVRCQLLTYREGDRFLILRGESLSQLTTGVESVPDKQFLDMNRIVSGAALKSGLDIYSIDPSVSHRELYGAYLFGNEIPRSEAVVVLRHRGAVIGVLNFEHLQQNMFSGYMAEVLKRIAVSVSPFVAALQNREDRLRQKEQGMLYVIASMIERLNGDLSHRVSNSVLQIRLRCEKLIKSDFVQDEVKEKLRGILTDVNVVKDRSEAFLKDLPGYLKAGPHNLRKIAEDAVRDACIEQPIEELPVSVRLSISDDLYVYASLLLCENLKNLIVNSIIGVSDALKSGGISIGNIAVKAELREGMDQLDRSGIAPSRIYVSIHDNGVGVPVDLLSRIRAYGFTTRELRGGSGFGLPAAIDYVQSVFGGDFDCGNSEEGGFFVRFYLLAYSEELKSITRSNGD